MMMVLQPRCCPLGDSALLVEFGQEIDLQTNRRVHALAAHLQLSRLEGIGEIVPTYASLLIHYDPLLLSYGQVLGWVREQIDASTAGFAPVPRLVEIPTWYGGAHGPDLPVVARHTGLSEEAVIRIHSQAEYQVYMMGFTPGFPYLGGMDPKISAPRLETPRTRVPAGSVGIAGKQTGIYSIESPGGWQLIGWTPLALFDPAHEPPCLLAPGDRLRFVPVREKELLDDD